MWIFYLLAKIKSDFTLGLDSHVSFYLFIYLFLNLIIGMNDFNFENPINLEVLVILLYLFKIWLFVLVTLWTKYKFIFHSTLKLVY